jgi:hypothetical protein
MSQSAATIIAAVITGVFAIAAAFVGRLGKGNGAEGGSRGNPVYLVVTVTLCTVLVFSLMIGVVGAVYENAGMRSISTAGALFAGFGLYMIVFFMASKSE